MYLREVDGPQITLQNALIGCKIGDIINPIAYRGRPAMTAMHTKFPNEEESRKLLKMAKSRQNRDIYLLSLMGICWIGSSLLDHHPAMLIALIIIFFAAAIYLLLKFTVLSRCPRCSNWGTFPLKNGNCLRCGMHLDPSPQEPSGLTPGSPTTKTPRICTNLHEFSK